MNTTANTASIINETIMRLNRCGSAQTAAVKLSNIRLAVKRMMDESEQILKVWAPQELEKAQSGWIQEVELAMDRDNGNSLMLTIGRVEEEQERVAAVFAEQELHHARTFSQLLPAPLHFVKRDFTHLGVKMSGWFLAGVELADYKSVMMDFNCGRVSATGCPKSFLSPPHETWSIPGFKAKGGYKIGPKAAKAFLKALGLQTTGRPEAVIQQGPSLLEPVRLFNELLPQCVTLVPASGNPKGLLTEGWSLKGIKDSKYRTVAVNFNEKGLFSVFGCPKGFLGSPNELWRLKGFSAKDGYKVNAETVKKLLKSIGLA